MAYLNAPSGNNFVSVALRLNDTTGGMREASTFHLSRRGEQIAVTDTNGDGHRDIVVTDRIDGTAVLLGGPALTSAIPKSSRAGATTIGRASWPTSTRSHQDVVVTSNPFPGTLALAYSPGDGQGGFGDRRLLGSGVRRDGRLRRGPQCRRPRRPGRSRERGTGRARRRPQACAGIRLRRWYARVFESGARHDRGGTTRDGDQHRRGAA